MLFRSVTVDYSVIRSVQQRWRVTIVNRQYHSLKRSFLNKVRVQCRITACHPMLSSLKENERAKRNIACRVKNSIQKKNLTQCKYHFLTLETIYLYDLSNVFFFFFRVSRKLDDKSKHVRSVIPTKDNPPPEMSSWLLQFQV